MFSTAFLIGLQKKRFVPLPTIVIYRAAGKRNIQIPNERLRAGMSEPVEKLSLGGHAEKLNMMAEEGAAAFKSQGWALLRGTRLISDEVCCHQAEFAQECVRSGQSFLSHEQHTGRSALVCPASDHALGKRNFGSNLCWYGCSFLSLEQRTDKSWYHPSVKFSTVCSAKSGKCMSRFLTAQTPSVVY